MKKSREEGMKQGAKQVIKNAPFWTKDEKIMKYMGIEIKNN